MTKRLDERNRPHRREVGETTAPSSDGLNNPVVMMAVGGFVLALVLAVAVFVGKSMNGTPDTTDTTDTAAPVATEAADAVAEATSTKALVSGMLTPGTSEEPTAVTNTMKFSAPEDQALDGAANAYFVTIETDKGNIVGELWPELAPETVNSFVFLARKGYFDGLNFHRVEPGFVIQGGDPAGNGSGGPGYSLKAEFSDVPHLPGVFSMARTNDPNSAGSQFFVVLGPEPASSLDNDYAVFGYTVEGMDVVQKIAVGDKMNKVTIEEKPKADSKVGPDDLRAGTVPGAAPTP